MSLGLYICVCVVYVSFKLSTKTNCEDCHSLLTKKSMCNDKYIQSINRGGLSIPSYFILMVCKHVVGIMQTLLTEKFETLFIASKNQKQIVCDLSIEAITNDTFIYDKMLGVCHCGTDHKNTALHIISVASNILLSNYCKKRNDCLIRSSNMRKMLIFS